MWDGGFQDYVHDWWNLMDFVMNSLYLATISLKIVAYIKVHCWLSVRVTQVLTVILTIFFLNVHHVLPCSVQRQQTQEPVGDVAPDAGR